nr:MAG TPA: hypothetical protein [Caudoviricetes sp.]
MKDFLKLNFNSMIKGFAWSGVVLSVALILLRELGILSISIDDTFIPLKFVLSVFGGIVYALVIIGNGVFNVEMKDLK